MPAQRRKIVWKPLESPRRMSVRSGQVPVYENCNYGLRHQRIGVFGVEFGGLIDDISNLLEVVDERTAAARRPATECLLQGHCEPRIRASKTRVNLDGTFVSKPCLLEILFAGVVQEIVTAQELVVGIDICSALVRDCYGPDLRTLPSSTWATLSASPIMRRSSFVSLNLNDDVRPAT